MNPNDFLPQLIERSENCELCSSSEHLEAFEVTSLDRELSVDTCVLLCHTCRFEIANHSAQSEFHWNCFYESMWNYTPAVQVLIHRILSQHNEESWTMDFLSQMTLDEALLTWSENDGQAAPTFDSNHVQLQTGDSVFLIQDLNVKGASFVAKRGTTVRNIRVGDDPEYIEGKVNGTSLMLKTCFVKKV